MLFSSMQNKNPFSVNNYNSRSWFNSKNNDQDRSILLGSSCLEKSFNCFRSQEALSKKYQQNEISFLTRHVQPYRPRQKSIPYKINLYEQKPIEKRTQFEKYLSLHYKYSKQYKKKLNSSQHLYTSTIRENPFLRKRLIQNAEDQKDSASQDQKANESFLPQQSKTKIMPFPNQLLQRIQPITLQKQYLGRLDNNLSFKAQDFDKNSFQNLSIEVQENQININNESLKDLQIKKHLERSRKKNILQENVNIFATQKHELDKISVKGKYFYLKYLNTFN